MDIIKVRVLMRHSFGKKKLKFQDSGRIRIACWLYLMLKTQKELVGYNGGGGSLGQSLQ